MRYFKRIISCFIILSILSTNLFAKTDEYERMAAEFSSVASMLKNPKIAIVPFSFTDNRRDTYAAGVIISERLTMKLVKQRSYKVVDRQHLEKILKEQKLQASGVVDVETAKSIGKILGVEALITGTMTEIAGGRLEVYAKLIKTETAEILTAASMIVTQDWAGKSITPVAEPQIAPARQPTLFKTTRSRGATKADGFFDFFILQSSKSTMKLTFKNAYYGMSERDLGIHFNNDGYLSYTRNAYEVEFPSLKTFGSGMPFGMRLIGFFDYIGFAFEILSYNQTVSAQKTTFSVNNSRATGFEFWVEDYLKMTTVAMDIGMYARFSKDVIQPYAGINIGLSLNRLYSPYIYAYDSAKVWKRELDAIQAGFMFNAPIGVRFVLGKGLTLFSELRTVTNTVAFKRGIKREKDKIIAKNTFLSVGLAAKF